MHAVHVVRLEGLKPALLRANLQLSLEVHFRHGTFQGNLEAKASVDRVEQLCRRQAVLHFERVGHLRIIA